MKKSTVLHLRFPFSFFLFPVFLFAFATAAEIIWWKAVLTFFILHFLIYPASNGYNSYFDKDEQSIGGLKFPPKVSKELYWVSLAFDILALALGFLLSNLFVLMVFVYGMISKAYSHPMIRLKNKPIGGWLAAGIFQGYFTFLMTIAGVSGLGLESLFEIKFQFAAVLSSLMLFGSYPMTQIYQHYEDKKRGDITLSLKLGVLGTFHFTAFFFGVATALFFVYFSMFYEIWTGVYFLIALIPVLVYFAKWYFETRSNHALADYDHTMKLNWISAVCLNSFFLWLYFS